MASKNASTPLSSRTTTDPHGSKSATLPIANPLKAFIAWVVGNSIELLATASGSMLYGSIMPPNSIEGRKMS